MKQTTISKSSPAASASKGSCSVSALVGRSEDMDLKMTGPTDIQKAEPQDKKHCKNATASDVQTSIEAAAPPAKKTTRVKGRPHTFSMDSEEQRSVIIKDLSGERTVYESNKPHKIRERSRKTGAEVWLSLPDSLLNKEGKRIVSDDPNLCFETMKKLLEAHPPEGDHPFYFVDDNGGPGIGITSISTCIDDNPTQSMAELIARYADLRHVPFTDTALACLSLYKKNGSVFTHYTCVNGIYRSESWSPTPIAFMKPPKKKRSQKNI